MKRTLRVLAVLLVAVVVGVTGGVCVATVLSFSADNASLRSDVDVLQAQLAAEGIEPAVPSDDPVVPPQNEPTVLVVEGDDGEDGDTIIGPQGPPGDTVVGPQGDKGDKGDPGDTVTVTGPQGPPGETVVGPAGPAGTDGEDGKPPEAIIFIAGGVRYTCTDPDGDGIYGECAQQPITTATEAEDGGNP